MKGLLHPAADEEFAEAVRYYAEIDPDLGVRFHCEIQRLIEDVCAHPEHYRKLDPPARRLISTDFPYALIYLEKPDRVWIVAVMHLKRRPATGTTGSESRLRSRRQSCRGLGNPLRRLMPRAVPPGCVRPGGR